MASSFSSSLMVSSSSPPRNWSYNVFTSFHGPDVRKTFLSHLRNQFYYNGITMFDDNRIERSQIIAPALKTAIGESRIAIVLLSKNYASSSWCLDELFEIVKCKEEIGQIVMTVFYGVDPSDVRKQTGDFGKVFNKTCDGKSEEQRQNWRQALTFVGNIAGYDFKSWDNEAKMIKKIASDVSHKVNGTPCRDFDGMVGLKGHLRKMESLLDLAYDGAKIVGISGPAGIGKSIIARALHSRLSNRFQHTCFMDNLRENYKNGLAEYGCKVRLQEQFLSNILNLNGRIYHLGVLKDRLHDKKVLIILDDVEHLDQLETLANIEWFGPGSRVIVTTENKEILQQHGIIDIYPVDFPSESKALMIFCLSAFKQISPLDGFMTLAYEVVRICGNLPLALCVLGSSLRGKSLADWKDELRRLKKCLDGRIESVLKVGYESLHENDQTLFLYIAIFFNHAHVDHVTSMLAENNLEVRLGLKNLTNRYLIHLENSEVVMHHLLQVMAIKVITKQNPWKREILVDAQEIHYILQNEAVNGSIVGVSFDVAETKKLMINPMAFKSLHNLLFLKVYNNQWHTRKLHIPEDIEFPRYIRLFHWDAYTGKSLPLSFCPENLVELNMVDSKIEKLWEGKQPLANLKKMNLSSSSYLRELPDLSNATNLETLDLFKCIALVELPSSIANLRKLKDIRMWSCKSLEVIPTLINLTSLTWIDMTKCSRLRNFQDVPTNITTLSVTETAVEESPASLRYCSRLEEVSLRDNGNLKTFLTHLPTSVTFLSLHNSGIERITDCISGLYNLKELILSSCKRLASLPDLPGSLELLDADNCISLESVSDPLNTPDAELRFTNCIKLSRQARRAIIQGSFVHGWALLPGRKVPKEFDYRRRGNSLTISGSTFNRFKVCVVASPDEQENGKSLSVSCRWKVIGNSVKSGDITFSEEYIYDAAFLSKEHLLIFHISLPLIDPYEVSRKIVLKFSSLDPEPPLDIIKCGVQILRDETDGSSNGRYGDEDDLYEDDLWDCISKAIYDKEDDEDEYKSESEEASGEKDEDDYKSISDEDESEEQCTIPLTDGPDEQEEQRRRRRERERRDTGDLRVPAIKVIVVRLGEQTLLTRLYSVMSELQETRGNNIRKITTPRDQAKSCSNPKTSQCSSACYSH